MSNMAEYITNKYRRSGCIIPVLRVPAPPPVLPVVASARVPTPVAPVIGNEDDHNNDDTSVADSNVESITSTTDSVEVVIEATAVATTEGAGKEITILSSTNDAKPTLPAKATATATALTNKIKKKVVPLVAEKEKKSSDFPSSSSSSSSWWFRPLSIFLLGTIVVFIETTHIDGTKMIDCVPTTATV
mmetsp:Transcript_5967/g.6423  ORF Transcript_5967/g.6423 Transcript_5967/m.6423 type:complete len:188 (+) Transcript_5967:535-1098(+)